MMTNFKLFKTLLQSPQGFLEVEQYIDTNSIVAFRKIDVPSKVIGGRTEAVLVFVPGNTFIVDCTVAEMRVLVSA